VTSSSTCSPTRPWDDAAFRAAVAEELDAFIDEQARRLEPRGPDAAHLIAEARRSVTGGKRLRAAFCYWGFRAVADLAGEAGDPSAAPQDSDEQADTGILRAAAALELLHASALVHDDYMDASDTRRGHPSSHMTFAAFHRKQGWDGDSDRYGAAAAILLGDLLLTWSDELFRTSGLDHDAVRRALVFFDATRSEMITGQFLDVSVQARGACDVEEAMRVLRYKSAKYSVERPLHVGAALAGADSHTLKALSEFGLPLGEAFQLRDDLLGVFGDPQVTGKPAGDDLVEGKRTVLVALALRAADEGDGRLLDAGLGTDLSSADVRKLREIIDASGAQADVERRIAALTTRSLQALERAPLAAGARAVLRDLAMAATQRKL
jgi:geranylgeranyl diphosphate synthase, type I